jgi:hypothetical protein
MFSDREMTTSALLRRPSAFLPLLLSTAALSLVIGYVVMYGVARQQDEGTTALLWQLMMALQVPIIVAFAANWMQRAPHAAVRVLALQVAAMLTAMAPVFLLGF